ncbi:MULTISPECIES: isocitrate lyase/phosphoenolpyruvate mutase family protein [unclassified Cryobacterium]|uniref:isocitrate lyase/PEP mutase family protein n=1 Tax=unclassified Cryobacterium TaxID=2649013 RepID=UPI002AB4925F|nr:MULTISPECIES: isocitrate lyase/phosphoenolpyruvate mutase family protein [unclassified Cryobacterium]MDY7543777.1 isocitrate lyase/phosphoenolpyruvate mutase family protein [Cryobacterium sp. 5B3]MEA9997583.1 isocitrate lyase/phosphoenolpyruvate mutase family protein [Cryobacterium sp. RTS3]MEB0264253.1 isocitrate lyase/phosphoenolpyruvate mutase family protein [Cryobacterium sp. 10I5]MEB0275216.1 isocitrate lyase/phosphoenolpyruvate mutase family protein [Cryobacterium sp. 5B3]
MSTFRQLHYLDSPLVLPNAWDVGSALAFVDAGFPAIGTTSFGIAASAGYPDGFRSSKAATIALAARLVRMSVHITADVEDGYSDDPAEVAESVAELGALGVAGVNLEDSRDGRLVAVSTAAAKISAVKRFSPDIFVNARVDNLWFAEEATVEAVLLRARAYADAGADGIFVPGLVNPEDIRRITADVALPVNVLAHPSLTAAELGELGVRRVSSGSLPYRAAIDSAVESVTALRDNRQTPNATSYWDVQARLVTFSQRSTN